MPRPTIRAATADDVQAIAKLGAQLGYSMPLPQLVRRLTRLLRSREHSVLVVDGEDGVVAWLHVCQRLTVESDPCAEIAGFVVEERYRRQGVGRQLLASAEDWARQQGLGRVRVRTRLGRAGARAFYRRCGFAVVKEQEVLDKTLAPVG